MSDKDITEKLLESYNDVFADIVNVLLFDGRQLVREDKWKRPRSLLECLKVPDELKPYVSDYKVNVFEIAWLPPETVAKFRSDFRIVADYFVQMRMNKDYNPPQETVRHVHEVLHLMAAVSGNRKFEETLRTEWRKKHGTGGEDMIDVFDKWEQRGRRDIQTLMKCMLEQNRIDDLRRASTDSEYLEKLLVEQGIAQPTSPRGAPRP